MTSPLRKEREIEQEENLDLENPDVRPAEAIREPETESDKPRLVRSEMPAAANRVESAAPPLRPGTAEVSPQGEKTTEGAPLFPMGELRELQDKWDKIQTGFVDQPRAAVHDAELLVASAMDRLTDVFSDERSKLERQWNSGSNVSTEDLRVVFQRYRSFFRRVLSV